MTATILCLLLLLVPPPFDFPICDVPDHWWNPCEYLERRYDPDPIRTITWDPSEGATGYRVYLMEPGGAWVQLAETVSPELSDVHEVDDLVGEQVWIVVTAENDFGESETEHPVGGVP
jgi:hypothetical protein